MYGCLSWKQGIIQVMPPYFVTKAMVKICQHIHAENTKMHIMLGLQSLRFHSVNLFLLQNVIALLKIYVTHRQPYIFLFHYGTARCYLSHLVLQHHIAGYFRQVNSFVTFERSSQRRKFVDKIYPTNKNCSTVALITYVTKIILTRTYRS